MSRALRILLVEDEPVDVMAFQRVVRKRALNVDLTVVESAEAALDFLREPQAGSSAGFETLDLVLADLRLPRLSGLDLLEETKRDERLRPLPLVMVSTSTQTSDVEMAYTLGAAGYFAKSLDFEEFANNIESICDFWSRAESATRSDAAYSA
jgi:CheY-like chemotaxis protein